MKNILIISETINEITRLKRAFGGDFRVGASNSAENAFAVIQNRLPDLILYRLGDNPQNMSLLFDFYKKLRQGETTEELPVVFVINEAAAKVVKETVKFKNAAVIESSVEPEIIYNVVNSFFKSQ